ncbi:MAG: ornithine carbamoyltransferase [Phycisphaerales bacterium]|nr:ornithine carbamoyltransferase [Phycisphaerales bacterium]
MASSLRGRHFIDMKNLSRDEITAVLDHADEMKRDRNAVRKAAPMFGKTMAMIFQKPSLRTRVSFETGMTLMGGHAIYLSPNDISLGIRETIEDIAIVLSRFADVIMARVFGHDIVEGLAKYSRVPVINGLSDAEHPCQILADLQTIRERKHRLEGLTTAFIGDGNNVCVSMMYAGAIVGMNVAVACPAGYEPPQPATDECRAIAAKTGATIRIVREPADAVQNADAVYTDVWASMGQESEAAKRREAFRGFQVNMALMRQARPDAIVLHCLPAHYGEEIDYAATRSPNSAIFDEAENRMHAQNALVAMLCAD